MAGAADLTSAGGQRSLTAGERAALSPGLVDALQSAGAAPRLIARTHPAARLSALWRGSVPILTRGERIFWPGVADDLSARGDRALAVLQHELQHVLDYVTGELTALGYLLSPRNWRYRYLLTPTSRWSDFGAEQRASLAEHLWLLERGRADLVVRDLGATPAPLERYCELVPWAQDASPPP